jgi:hypothetical protein
VGPVAALFEFIPAIATHSECFQSSVTSAQQTPECPGPGARADGNCVTLVQISNPYPSLQTLLQHGGAVPVIFAGRLVIQVNYDYVASNHLRVLSRDDRTYITPRGPAIVDLSRVPVSKLPSRSIEVIRDDRPLCEERVGHG